MEKNLPEEFERIMSIKGAISYLEIPLNYCLYRKWILYDRIEIYLGLTYTVKVKYLFVVKDATAF